MALTAEQVVEQNKRKRRRLKYLMDQLIKQHDLLIEQQTQQNSYLLIPSLENRELLGLAPTDDYPDIDALPALIKARITKLAVEYLNQTNLSYVDLHASPSNIVKETKALIACLNTPPLATNTSIKTAWEAKIPDTVVLKPERPQARAERLEGLTLLEESQPIFAYVALLKNRDPAKNQLPEQVPDSLLLNSNTPNATMPNPLRNDTVIDAIKNEDQTTKPQRVSEFVNNYKNMAFEQMTGLTFDANNLEHSSKLKNIELALQSYLTETPVAVTRVARKIIKDKSGAHVNHIFMEVHTDEPSDPAKPLPALTTTYQFKALTEDPELLDMLDKIGPYGVVVTRSWNGSEYVCDFMIPYNKNDINADKLGQPRGIKAEEHGIYAHEIQLVIEKMTEKAGYIPKSSGERFVPWVDQNAANEAVRAANESITLADQTKEDLFTANQNLTDPGAIATNYQTPIDRINSLITNLNNTRANYKPGRITDQERNVEIDGLIQKLTANKNALLNDRDGFTNVINIRSKNLSDATLLEAIEKELKASIATIEPLLGQLKPELLSRNVSGELNKHMALYLRAIEITPTEKELVEKKEKILGSLQESFIKSLGSIQDNLEYLINKVTTTITNSEAIDPSITENTPWIDATRSVLGAIYPWKLNTPEGVITPVLSEKMSQACETLVKTNENLKAVQAQYELRKKLNDLWDRVESSREVFEIILFPDRKTEKQISPNLTQEFSDLLECYRDVSALQSTIPQDDRANTEFCEEVLGKTTELLATSLNKTAADIQEFRQDKEKKLPESIKTGDLLQNLNEIKIFLKGVDDLIRAVQDQIPDPIKTKELKNLIGWRDQLEATRKNYDDSLKIQYDDEENRVFLDFVEKGFKPYQNYTIPVDISPESLNEIGRRVCELMKLSDLLNPRDPEKLKAKRSIREDGPHKAREQRLIREINAALVDLNNDLLSKYKEQRDNLNATIAERLGKIVHIRESVLDEKFTPDSAICFERNAEVGENNEQETFLNQKLLNGQNAVYNEFTRGENATLNEIFEKLPKGEKWWESLKRLTEAELDTIIRNDFEDVQAIRALAKVFPGSAFEERTALEDRLEAIRNFSTDGVRLVESIQSVKYMDDNQVKIENTVIGIDELSRICDHAEGLLYGENEVKHQYQLGQAYEEYHAHKKIPKVAVTDGLAQVDLAAKRFANSNNQLKKRITEARVELLSGVTHVMNEVAKVTIAKAQTRKLPGTEAITATQADITNFKKQSERLDQFAQNAYNTYCLEHPEVNKKRWALLGYGVNTREEVMDAIRARADQGDILAKQVIALQEGANTLRLTVRNAESSLKNFEINEKHKLEYPAGLAVTAWNKWTKSLGLGETLTISQLTDLASELSMDNYRRLCAAIEKLGSEALEPHSKLNDYLTVLFEPETDLINGTVTKAALFDKKKLTAKVDDLIRTTLICVLSKQWVVESGNLTTIEEGKKKLLKRNIDDLITMSENVIKNGGQELTFNKPLSRLVDPSLNQKSNLNQSTIKSVGTGPSLQSRTLSNKVVEIPRAFNIDVPLEIGKTTKLKDTQVGKAAGNIHDNGDPDFAEKHANDLIEALGLIYSPETNDIITERLREFSVGDPYSTIRYSIVQVNEAYARRGKTFIYENDPARIHEEILALKSLKSGLTTLSVNYDAEKIHFITDAIDARIGQLSIRPGVQSILAKDAAALAAGQAKISKKTANTSQPPVQEVSEPPVILTRPQINTSCRLTTAAVLPDIQQYLTETENYDFPDQDEIVKYQKILDEWSVNLNDARSSQSKTTLSSEEDTLLTQLMTKLSTTHWLTADEAGQLIPLSKKLGLDQIPVYNNLKFLFKLVESITDTRSVSKSIIHKISACERLFSNISDTETLNGLDYDQVSRIIASNNKSNTNPFGDVTLAPATTLVHNFEEALNNGYLIQVTKKGHTTGYGYAKGKFWKFDTLGHAEGGVFTTLKFFTKDEWKEELDELNKSNRVEFTVVLSPNIKVQNTDAIDFGLGKNAQSDQTLAQNPDNDQPHAPAEWKIVSLKEGLNALKNYYHYFDSSNDAMSGQAANDNDAKITPMITLLETILQLKDVIENKSLKDKIDNILGLIKGCENLYKDDGKSQEFKTITSENFNRFTANIEDAEILTNKLILEIQLNDQYLGRITRNLNTEGLSLDEESTNAFIADLFKLGNAKEKSEEMVRINSALMPLFGESYEPIIKPDDGASSTVKEGYRKKLKNRFEAYQTIATVLESTSLISAHSKFITALRQKGSLLEEECKTLEPQSPKVAPLLGDTIKHMAITQEQVNDIKSLVFNQSDYDKKLLQEERFKMVIGFLKDIAEKLSKLSDKNQDEYNTLKNRFDEVKHNFLQEQLDKSSGSSTYYSLVEEMVAVEAINLPGTSHSSNSDVLRMKTEWDSLINRVELKVRSVYAKDSAFNNIVLSEMIKNRFSRETLEFFDKYNDTDANLYERQEILLKINNALLGKEYTIEPYNEAKEAEIDKLRGKLIKTLWPRTTQEGIHGLLEGYEADPKLIEKIHFYAQFIHALPKEDRNLLINSIDSLETSHDKRTHANEETLKKAYMDNIEALLKLQAEIAKYEQLRPISMQIDVRIKKLENKGKIDESTINQLRRSASTTATRSTAVSSKLLTLKSLKKDLSLVLYDQKSKVPEAIASSILSCKDEATKTRLSGKLDEVVEFHSKRTKRFYSPTQDDFKNNAIALKELEYELNGALVQGNIKLDSEMINNISKRSENLRERAGMAKFPDQRMMIGKENGQITTKDASRILLVLKKLICGEPVSLEASLLNSKGFTRLAGNIDQVNPVVYLLNKNTSLSPEETVTLLSSIADKNGLSDVFKYTGRAVCHAVTSANPPSLEGPFDPKNHVENYMASFNDSDSKAALEAFLDIFAYIAIANALQISNGRVGSQMDSSNLSTILGPNLFLNTNFDEVGKLNQLAQALIKDRVEKILVKNNPFGFSIDQFKANDYRDLSSKKDAEESARNLRVSEAKSAILAFAKLKGPADKLTTKLVENGYIKYFDGPESYGEVGASLNEVVIGLTDGLESLVAMMTNQGVLSTDEEVLKAGQKVIEANFNTPASAVVSATPNTVNANQTNTGEKNKQAPKAPVQNMIKEAQASVPIGLDRSGAGIEASSSGTATGNPFAKILGIFNLFGSRHSSNPSVAPANVNNSRPEVPPSVATPPVKETDQQRIEKSRLVLDGVKSDNVLMQNSHLNALIPTQNSTPPKFDKTLTVTAFKSALAKDQIDATFEQKFDAYLLSLAGQHLTNVVEGRGNASMVNLAGDLSLALSKHLKLPEGPGLMTLSMHLIHDRVKVGLDRREIKVSNKDGSPVTSVVYAGQRADKKANKSEVKALFKLSDALNGFTLVEAAVSQPNSPASNNTSPSSSGSGSNATSPSSSTDLSGNTSPSSSSSGEVGSDSILAELQECILEGAKFKNITVSDDLVARIELREKLLKYKDEVALLKVRVEASKPNTLNVKNLKLLFSYHDLLSTTYSNLIKFDRPKTTIMTDDEMREFKSIMTGMGISAERIETELEREIVNRNKKIEIVTNKASAVNFNQLQRNFKAIGVALDALSHGLNESNPKDFTGVVPIVSTTNAPSSSKNAAVTLPPTTTTTTAATPLVTPQIHVPPPVTNIVATITKTFDERMEEMLSMSASLFEPVDADATKEFLMTRRSAIFQLKSTLIKLSSERDKKGVYNLQFADFVSVVDEALEVTLAAQRIKNRNIDDFNKSLAVIEKSRKLLATAYQNRNEVQAKKTPGKEAQPIIATADVLAIPEVYAQIYSELYALLKAVVDYGKTYAKIESPTKNDIDQYINKLNALIDAHTKQSTALAQDLGSNVTIRSLNQAVFHAKYLKDSALPQILTIPKNDGTYWKVAWLQDHVLNLEVEANKLTPPAVPMMVIPPPIASSSRIGSVPQSAASTSKFEVFMAKVRENKASTQGYDLALFDSEFKIALKESEIAIKITGKSATDSTRTEGLKQLVEFCMEVLPTQNEDGTEMTLEERKNYISVKIAAALAPSFSKQARDALKTTLAALQPPAEADKSKKFNL